MSNEKTAITPTRAEDFPEWYQQVIKAADLAENSETRGCMVIKPWGYGIWEQIQRTLDREIKRAGAVNAYFPILDQLETDLERLEVQIFRGEPPRTKRRYAGSRSCASSMMKTRRTYSFSPRR